jgi:hypothetical protein
MSGAMGGQFWVMPSVKHLTHCMENCHAIIHTKKHSYVPPAHPVCHIEGISIILESHPSNETHFKAERMFVYANHSVTKHFPLPESFAPRLFKKDHDGFAKFVCYTD